MDLLKELTQTPAVPGREARIRDLIRRHAEPHVDEIQVDAMGSLHARRDPRPRGSGAERPLRVMLAAHMDQIGFLVKHVDEKGYVRINPVGGFDPRNLFARGAVVCTDSGDLPAVMNPAVKPIHMATDEDKKKVPELHELYLDLGLPAEEVHRRVQVGDMVVLRAEFTEVGHTVVSQCLDNRIGCWALLRTLEQLETHACELHFVWTVQEEVGLRGAGPAAYGVEPDIALSCDTTLCCQTPGVSEDQWVTQLGEGVCLKVMDSSTIADIDLVKELETTARDRNIRVQRGVLPRGGQDGGMIQRARHGVRTGVLACPVKYIHTVTEMASRTDLDSYRDLLVAWLGAR